IQSGDVITAVDGVPVKGSRELSRKIGMMAPNSSVKLSILRKGEEKTLTLTLGEMPSERQALASEQEGTPKVPHLGLSLAPAAEVAGSEKQGVVVTGVEPDGPAAEHGVKIGDVILEISGKPVSRPSDVRQQP